MTGVSKVYYRDVDNDACLAYGGSHLETDPKVMVFARGTSTPVTPATFAETTEVRTGTKQLQLRKLGSFDGSAYALGFFDSVHGVPCAPAPIEQLSDGTARCLPLDLMRASYFADAACSVPITTVSQVPPSTCGGAGTAFVSRFEGTENTFDGLCLVSQARRHVYPLGGERYLGTIYTDRSGTCSLVDTSAPDAPQGPFYETGPEIPQEAFATVKWVHPASSR
jgi:hypothetical protein